MISVVSAEFSVIIIVKCHRSENRITDYPKGLIYVDLLEKSQVPVLNLPIEKIGNNFKRQLQLCRK